MQLAAIYIMLNWTEVIGLGLFACVYKLAFNVCIYKRTNRWRV